MKMSKGEMMVWAAAFANERRDLMKPQDVLVDGHFEKKIINNASIRAADMACKVVKSMQSAKVQMEDEGYDASCSTMKMLHFMMEDKDED